MCKGIPAFRSCQIYYREQQGSPQSAPYKMPSLVRSFYLFGFPQEQTPPETRIWVQVVYLETSQVVLVVKTPPANSGDITDLGSIPGLGRSPGGGHGNPLQYSWVENLMDRGAWWATVHGSQRVGLDWSDWACMHSLSGNDLKKTSGGEEKWLRKKEWKLAKWNPDLIGTPERPCERLWCSPIWGTREWGYRSTTSCNSLAEDHSWAC